MTPLLKQAIYFAAEKHDGQYRKGGKTPYIVHPFMVAMKVSEYTKDVNIIAAAVLHDVIEDCGVTYVELVNLFNIEIADMVLQVSKSESSNKLLDFRTRKSLYIENLTKANEGALLITAADKISNMSSYFQAVIDKSPLVDKLFKGTLDEYIWYYEEVGNTLKSKVNLKTYEEYVSILNYYIKKVRA